MWFLKRAPSRIVYNPGRCLVHVDDNFDGRLQYHGEADVTGFDGPKCFALCEQTIVTGCKYTKKGACTYQLVVLINFRDPVKRFYDCEIMDTGIQIIPN